MSTETQQNTAVVEKVKEPSKYNVIIHDNDKTSFDEVIFVVSRCFDKSEQQANEIADKVHKDGKGICGTYTKEMAEMKLQVVEAAKQMLSNNMPWRTEAIMMLKFTMKKAN